MALAKEYFGAPLYIWIMIIVSAIGVIISIIALPRLREEIV